MDETARMLALLNDTFPDITTMDPLAARAVVDARVRPADNIDDVRATDDVRTDGGVPLRVYHPHEPRRGAPGVVFAHGGGFLHGSIASHDAFCRRWARHTGSTVVSVGYRLAPEHRAPAARDDVVAAARWARAHGYAEHGVLLAGDSSGATLAAAAAIALRDAGDSPVVGQALIYPFLDPGMSTASHREHATGAFVTAGLLSYYWRTYLGDAGEWDETATPYAVSDLRDLPPALVITAGLDPLEDEGIAYAARLRDAGVPVRERRYPDQFHGFLTIGGYGPATAACEILWHDLVHHFSARPTAGTLAKDPA